MSVVKLFGSEITLDKKIIVTLDGGLEVFDIFKDCWENVSYAQTYKDLIRQIKSNYPMIITPMTHILTPEMMERGYDLFVYSNKKTICFSELLMGNEEKSFGREIRETQNWEKMLYSNCFNIDVPELR